MFTKLSNWLVENHKVPIAVVCSLLFGGLWVLADKVDVSSTLGSLAINLSATALAVLSTVWLLDWIQEKHKSFLTIIPRQAAKSDLDSVCFGVAFALGPPSLRNFSDLVSSHAAGRFDEKRLLKIQSDILLAIKGVGLQAFQEHRAIGYTKLEAQLKKEIEKVDDVWRLYGDAIKPAVRDRVIPLRASLMTALSIVTFYKDNEDLGEAILLSQFKLLAEAALQVNKLIATEANW